LIGARSNEGLRMVNMLICMNVYCRWVGRVFGQQDYAAAVAVAPVDAAWVTSMPAAFAANALFDL